MFFTTNPPNPEQIDPELLRAIENLQTQKRSAIDVLKLSDIDRATAVGIMPTFNELPTESRRFAVRQMIEQAEANVQLDFSRVLHQLLSDPDVEVRALSIQGLWEDESLSFADQLIDMLESEIDPYVRETIAESLGRFGYLAALGQIDQERSGRIRDTLIELYRSNEQVATRKRALESVAYFSDDVEVEEAIADAFESILQDLRIAAIFAMGRNLSDRWLPTLLGEMHDTDPEVRFEAARASGEFGDERAVTELLDLVDDEDAEVQMAAIGALGQIGGKVAVGALRRLVRSDDPVVSDAAQDALSQAMLLNDPMRISPQ